MNHVSVSPTDGNGPTQGQRKTLTRVGIEPTTFGLVLSNHYVHTGYHEMRTHRRDSVHVLAVTRAVVLEICSRRRFIFKMSTNRGKGKNNSFSMIFFFPIKGMKVQQENYKLRFSDCTLGGSRSKLTVSGTRCHETYQFIVGTILNLYTYINGLIPRW